jgi:hypothetical protein
MPRVPTLSRQVDPTALPGARRTAAETAASRGAGVFEAEAGLALTRGRNAQMTGNAIAGFGDTITRAGSVLGQIAQAEQQRADEVALLDADNKLSAWERTRLYDPNGGALATKGRDSFGLPESVAGEFEQAAGEIEKGLGTDRQRRAFQRVKGNRSAQIDLTLRRHVLGEMQAYEAGELKAFVDNSLSDMAANATDPRRAGFELAKAVDAVQRSGPRLGLGPEQIEAQVGAIRTKGHVGVIESLISQGQPGAARAYFEEAKEQINGDAITRVEKVLREGTIRKQSQTLVDKIVAEGGTLTEQRNKAKAIDDPDVRDSVTQRLEHEAVVRERADREANENLLRGVYAVVEESGGDVSVVEPALWAQLDAKDLAGIRAYARGIAKGEPVETDLETYYALMNRAVSTNKGFLTENLLRYKGKLSEGDFQQMANLQRSLRENAIGAAAEGERNKNKLVVDEFMSKTQVFDDRLTAYGIDPNPKAGTPEAKSVAQLRGMLDRQVRSLSGGETGKTATNDEYREMLDGLLSSQVTVRKEGSWMGAFTSAPFFDADVQRRPFELSVDDVPQSDRTRIEQLLRARRIPVNDATVLEAFIEARFRQ